MKFNSVVKNSVGGGCEARAFIFYVLIPSKLPIIGNLKSLSLIAFVKPKIPRIIKSGTMTRMNAPDQNITRPNTPAIKPTIAPPIQTPEYPLNQVKQENSTT